MSDVEARRVFLALLVEPTVAERNELRDCEIALGMTMAGPRERSEAVRRCERNDADRRSRILSPPTSNGDA